MMIFRFLQTGAGEYFLGFCNMTKATSHIVRKTLDTSTCIPKGQLQLN